jgi:hypothetical protein
MEIGRTLPAHRELAELYPQSKRIQAALIEYIIIIMQVCQKTFQDSFLARLKTVTFAALTDPSLGDIKAQLEEWKDVIDLETNVLMGLSLRKLEKEAQKSSLKDIIKRAAQYQRPKWCLEDRRRWLEACSKYPFEIAWKSLRKQGNANFFRSEQSYLEFKTQTESHTLLCLGKLGSGKSVLLANIVDDLVLDNDKRTYLIAYFFISSDNTESMKARTILGCIARQLLQAIPHTDWVERLGEPSLDVDLEDLTRIITTTVPPHQRAFLVLDGLDYLSSDEMSALFTELAGLRESLQVLICASFRLEASGLPEYQFRQLKIDSTMRIPDLNPDISTFVEQELIELTTSRLLVVRNPELLEEIHDFLVGGADGM